MSKHKKTRKQKVISDLRRKLQSVDRISSSAKDHTISLPQKFVNTPPEKPSKKISTENNYLYLLHDLSKTGILTGSIIVAQIILFFLLKNHAVVLPMVRY